MTNFRDWTDKFYAFSKTGEKLSEIDISQVFTSYHYLHCQNDTLVARIGSRKGARTLYFDKRGQSWNLSGKQSLSVEGKYYVSNFLGHMRGHSTLYKIEDPRSMNIYTGDRPKADKLIDQKESKSTEGMKKWLDIIGRPRTMELLSSFVRNNRLLHLYSDDNDVYICQSADDDSAIDKTKTAASSMSIALKSRCTTIRG